MHPHLLTEAKQQACKEYIAQLEECHARGFIARSTGVCNEQKHALTMCLRGERLERTKRNREEADRRNEIKRKAWEKLEAES